MIKYPSPGLSGFKAHFQGISGDFQKEQNVSH